MLVAITVLNVKLKIFYSETMITLINDREVSLG